MGLLRFIVALAVASGHAGSFFGAYIFPKMPGSHAGQVFYIVSGFLIALILSGKYADTREGNWIFYSNRAVKIYVPYLTILAGTVLVWIVIYSATGGAGPLAIFGSPMAYTLVAVSIGSAIAINHLLVRPIDVWRQRRAKTASIRDPDKQSRMAVA